MAAGCWASRAGAAVLVGSLAAGTPRASADSLQNLRALSLEDLSSLEITSVSKQREALASAPAAIYVITHDEIVRSGARSVPEMLRLAPNLEVFQTSPSNYVVTARGFSGNNPDQNFPDKLLVLIDGRSVY
ncbi:MAG: Plug domain-containing protein, partial [Alphaproteobacteria bacterium]|nr:Plug domain-containing protein [Alphaproteobacteria bacterium]